MNILVIFIAVCAIILSIICKIYDFSMVYPTLLLILAIMLNLVSNEMKNRELRKEKVNINEIKTRNKQ